MTHLPIPPDFVLYDVTVEESWVANRRFAVMAKQPSSAKELALRLAKLSTADADSEGRIAVVCKASASDLCDADDIENDALIDWPDKCKEPVKVNCRELLDQLLEVDPEEVERIRLAAIERDNGQIPLIPEEQPIRPEPEGTSQSYSRQTTGAGHPPAASQLTP